ncbi:MAG: S8 family peptidase [Alphaproteobacteria bacterium GM202ARS2]|nr:S8 family peptidase [Alphaproteobacteria bacterium GM202ARS2]
MTERPLLKLPPPKRQDIPKEKPRNIVEPVQPLGVGRQYERLGQRFEGISQILSDPQKLAELESDPAAIAPERALVFVIAGKTTDFYQAIRKLPEFDLLDEEESEMEQDEDFIIPDTRKKRIDKPKKKIGYRKYFTMPSTKALAKIVSLWKLWQNKKPLPRGFSQWKHVFAHLIDIRPWGPEERITEETRANWREDLKMAPNKPIQFEVEFWFRKYEHQRKAAHEKLNKILQEADGEILHRSTIEPIRYDAVLVKVKSKYIEEVLEKSDHKLAIFNEVMIVRPQSLVKNPQYVKLEETDEVEETTSPKPTEPPRAALLDGVPMAKHAKLDGRLSIEDPDEFETKYGKALEHNHGTGMASLIIHGDLNNQSASLPIRSRLYVRPVMYPQQNWHTELGEDVPQEDVPQEDVPQEDTPQEDIPRGQLIVDLIWRSFIHMFEGEGDSQPTAPSVKVINLSLGDLRRPFSGVLSPWARLLDYISWKYKILILVSSGNITNSIPLNDVDSWEDFESSSLKEREKIMLKAILNQKAERSLLSPSESINVLTVGACHDDVIESREVSTNVIDPYESSYLPNPSSALGLGYLGSVKPEILLPGGREHVKRERFSSSSLSVEPVKASRLFGIGVAAPDSSGRKKTNISGTSVATALATHGAVKILESLDEIPLAPSYPNVDDEFQAVIVKTLLVHAAQWDSDLAEQIDNLLKEINDAGTHPIHRRADTMRFLGFGKVNIERAIECTARRATMINWGKIRAKKEDEFRIPLPSQLENLPGFRAMTATVGWFTPLNINHRNYRAGKLEVKPGADKNFSLGVETSKHQPSHHSFGKGTVYHHRWDGKKARTFSDDGNLVLKVVCKSPTSGLDDEIPYGLAVTLEVGEEVTVPVYDEIRNRLRQAIRIT